MVVCGSEILNGRYLRDETRLTWSSISNSLQTTTLAPTCSINRYYDPTTGSFISVDPDLQSTDQAYVFTNDNPLNATDPLGQCSLLSWNCWTSIAKKVVKVSVVAVELMNGNAPAAAKTLGKTIGECVSGGAAFGIGAIGSVCAGATGNGTPFFSVTGGAGGGSPSAFLGVGGIFSNAHTPSELSKDFTYVGGSVGEGLSVGGEGAIGKAPNKKTIWVGSGLVNVGISPVPFEYHAGESWTWVS